MGPSPQPLRPVLALDSRSRARPATPPESGLSLSVNDVYYILFRHKIKIILWALAGFIGAGIWFTYRQPPYISQAKLFVRYVVVEGMSQRPSGDEQVTKSPDMRGETIISSEQEIIASLDLLRQVAQVIGPEKILANAGGGNDINAATVVISRGLTTDSPRPSSVIEISFQHPDPVMAQSVLREIIAQYLKKHAEIHNSAGMVGDFLTQETDQLHSRLQQTEDELRKAKSKAGVVSIDDAKKTNSEQVAMLRQQIFAAQAELAERESIIHGFDKPEAKGSLATSEAATPVTSVKASGSTSVAPDAPVSDPSVKSAIPTPAEPEISSPTFAEYSALSGRLDSLRRREQEFLLQFSEDSSRVKEIRAQISEAGAAKQRMEKEHPRLVAIPTAGAASSKELQPGRVPPVDIVGESIRVTGLRAKIKVLSTQMESLRAESVSLDQLEGNIHELTRRKDLEETNYRHYAASLEQSRINEALGSGRVSNINQIQTPSAPAPDVKKLQKVGGGIAVAGLAIGLGWAFLFELVLDRSVRRPVDVERKLKLPLFMSIPEFSPKRPGWFLRRKLKGPSEAKLNPATVVELVGNASSGSNKRELIVHDRARMLRPFHETLRDRLIDFFESQGLTHKPKLVAVTGLGNRSGVTTIAAGLAESLSETGDGNVLLVDMTTSQGSAQQFMKGKAACGLDDLLGARDSAQAQENLYVVTDSQSSDQLSRNLPRRFTQLIPKLKASDFDYIIFDMPPVSQLSITPRLASFMDFVLFVIESEKANQDTVERATALLSGSTGHLGAVLNKNRSYVPSWLHHDLPSGT